MPRVLMCAINDASSIDAPSPMVTKSGSVIIGSPPFGYKHTSLPMRQPSARKYHTRYWLPAIISSTPVFLRSPRRISSRVR
jgi:hypothetical protein